MIILNVFTMFIKSILPYLKFNEEHESGIRITKLCSETRVSTHVSQKMGNTCYKKVRNTSLSIKMPPKSFLMMQRSILRSSYESQSF